MAAIDKIYGTADEWQQFRDWLEVNNSALIDYLYPKPKERGVISSFPHSVDGWLILNCDLPFILEQIIDQYELELCLQSERDALVRYARAKRNGDKEGTLLEWLRFDEATRKEIESG